MQGIKPVIMTRACGGLGSLFSTTSCVGQKIFRIGTSSGSMAWREQESRLSHRHSPKWLRTMELSGRASSAHYLDRKELKNIFPTLSYQLACRYPAFRAQIIPVIKRDPSAAHNSLISQLNDLIVDPLSSTGISCVIIIDALDECVDDQPASAILSVLARFFKQLPSVKFFITGRPEPRIRAGFRLPLLEPSTQVFPLHKVELSSVDEDIRLYLQEKLTAVAKRRSDFDLTNPWPCDEDLITLTKKSSGLFIFASTLVRFVESEHHEPNERVQLLVTPPESTIHEGRAGIDPLYTHILLSGFCDVKDDTVLANLRRVLGAVVLAFNPLSQVQVARILDVKQSFITSTLRHLHSVLLIPAEGSKELRFFHKSFPDFLQDPDRCSDSRFFISSPVYHADMALGCLKLLTGLKRNPCDLPDFVMNRDIPNIPELLEDKLGGALRYACAYWAMHVQSSTIDNDYAIRLVASVTGFFEKDALQWVEVMSLENRLEGVIHNINNLTDWLGMVCELISNRYGTLADLPQKHRSIYPLQAWTIRRGTTSASRCISFVSFSNLPSTYIIPLYPFRRSHQYFIPCTSQTTLPGSTGALHIGGPLYGLSQELLEASRPWRSSAMGAPPRLLLPATTARWAYTTLSWVF